MFGCNEIVVKRRAVVVTVYRRVREFGKAVLALAPKLHRIIGAGEMKVIDLFNSTYPDEFIPDSETLQCFIHSRSVQFTTDPGAVQSAMITVSAEDPVDRIMLDFGDALTFVVQSDLALQFPCVTPPSQVQPLNPCAFSLLMSAGRLRFVPKIQGGDPKNGIDKIKAAVLVKLRAENIGWSSQSAADLTGKKFVAHLAALLLYLDGHAAKFASYRAALPEFFLQPEFTNVRAQIVSPAGGDWSDSKFGVAIYHLQKVIYVFSGWVWRGRHVLLY
jgi:hypothetical protein